MITRDSREATCGSSAPQAMTCEEGNHFWTVCFKNGPLQPGAPCNCGGVKWPGPVMEREQVQALEEAKADAPV